jgi:hypothetical protein
MTPSCGNAPLKTNRRGAERQRRGVYHEAVGRPDDPMEGRLYPPPGPSAPFERQTGAL